MAGFCQELTKCYPQEIRTAFEKNFTEAERDVIKEYFNTEITSCANVGDKILSWNAELQGTDGLQDKLTGDEERFIELFNLFLVRKS